MDKKYWDGYYSNHGYDVGISGKSSFADYCSKKYFYNRPIKILELGCGNGRDAIYFSEKGHQVLAVDQSINAVEIEIKRSKNNNLTAMSADFVYDVISDDCEFDAVYSRFTLHSISQKDQCFLLPKVHGILKDGGLFCIEARTVKDPLYGKGDYCEEHTYITDHKRRFVDSYDFVAEVVNLGFEIVFFTEEANLSVYKGDNPVLMRIILRKRDK
jgi:tellurite methyltransferase